MIKSIEMTGRNEDDAIAAALTKLGLTRDDVSVEVLDRARAGFLGIGAQPARVRVSYEVPDPDPIPAPVKAEPKPAAKAPQAKKAEPQELAPQEAKPQAEKKAPKPAKAEVRDLNPTEKTEKLGSFLKGLFERMGISAEAAISYNEADNLITVELTGDKVGALIGRRGETLDAIQHLANYVVNSGDEDRTRINIDAENYRAKRADSLTSLARKTAAKVVKYRRNMTLEPMNAYERHVIHTALQDFDGVTTYSTGTEPNRRVVVAYDRATAPADTGYGRDRRQRRERPARTERPVQAAPAAEAEAQPAAPVPEAPAPKKDTTTREWC